MQNTTIGTAQIKLVVDASQVQQGLNEAKTTVENTTETTGKGFEEVQQRIDGSGAAAERFGEHVEQSVGGGFERATAAADTFRQAMTGVMAGVGIVTAISSAAEALAKIIHSAGNAAEAAAAQFSKLNQQIVGTPAGEESIKRLKAEIEKLDEEIVNIDNKNTFSRIYDDLSGTKNRLLSQRAELVKDLADQEKIVSDKAVLAETENAKKRATAIKNARLEGIDKINQEETDALQELSDREKALNDSSKNEKLKSLAREAFEQERMEIRETAAMRRRKIAEDQSKKAAEDKARAEADAARSAEAQTRESERRAQVESNARAQAQRDQAMTDAMNRQAFAMSQLLQEIRFQTEVLKNTRRVL